MGLSDIGQKDEYSHHYLATLCVDAAHGIDLIARGKEEKEYNAHIKELAEIIDKYGRKCTGEEDFCWPYLPLWRAFMQEKKKEIRTVSELSLEMKLFANELFDINNLSAERQKEVLKFCCTASGYFMAYMPSWKQYLAA